MFRCGLNFCENKFTTGTGGTMALFLFGFILILTVVSPAHSRQQENNTYFKEKIKDKNFDKARWNSLKKELEYGEIKKEKVESKKKNKKGGEKKKDTFDFSSFSAFNINSVVLQSFFFILAVGIIVFVMIKFFGSFSPPNPKVETEEITLENIEDVIHEADLEKFLRIALEQKDYRQAIRLYYLIIIREFSTKNWIFWKKEKTNQEYLNEMRSKGDFQVFRELTYTFEFVWYSDKVLSEQQYQNTSEKFKAYVQSLKGKQ